MEDSHIQLKPSGAIILTGNDAHELYRAMQIRSAIGLYMKTGMIPTRGVTITKLLRAAKQYTGKIYGRTPAAYAVAINDLTVWIDNMRTAIPTTDERNQ